MSNWLRNIFIAIVTITVCVETFAQGGGGYPLPYRRAAPGAALRPNTRFIGNSKLYAIKKAYINQQLNLTPEEAERFWPVYEQYQEELDQILTQRRFNNANHNSSPADLDQVDKDISYEQRLLQVRKKYYRGEFLKVLPRDKIEKLYQSEREFKNELIRHLREHSK